MISKIESLFPEFEGLLDQNTKYKSTFFYEISKFNTAQSFEEDEACNYFIWHGLALPLK